MQFILVFSFYAVHLGFQFLCSSFWFSVSMQFILVFSFYVVHLGFQFLCSSSWFSVSMQFILVFKKPSMSRRSIEDWFASAGILVIRREFSSDPTMARRRVYWMDLYDVGDLRRWPSGSRGRVQTESTECGGCPASSCWTRRSVWNLIWCSTPLHLTAPSYFNVEKNTRLYQRNRK